MRIKLFQHITAVPCEHLTPKGNGIEKYCIMGHSAIVNLCTRTQVRYTGTRLGTLKRHYILPLKK